MKLVLAGLALVLSFALAASCSITHRTGDYACTKNSDCNSGRECVDGFCVISGTSTPDAPISNSDARLGDAGNSCPSQCTSCNPGTHSCVIDCANGANCQGNVACPTGWTCDVKCDTDNSCRNGVTCTGSTSCTVECTGKMSCQGVQCGTGACDVQCSGPSSCKAVACGSSCACDVRCIGANSCSDAVMCSSQACRIGLGCTSFPQACHSC